MGSATASRCHLALLLVLVAAAPCLSLPTPVESVADEPTAPSRSPVSPSSPSTISPAELMQLIRYHPYLLAPPVNGFPAGFPFSGGLFPGLAGLGPSLGPLAGLGGLGGFGGLGGLPAALPAGLGLGSLSSLAVGGSVAVVNPNGTVSTYQITLTPVSTVPLNTNTAPGAAASVTAPTAASMPTPVAAPAAGSTDVPVTPRIATQLKVIEPNEDREHPPRTDVEVEEFYSS